MKLKKRVFLTTTLILFGTTFITSFFFSVFIYQFSENIFRQDALILTKNISLNIVQIYQKYYEDSFSAFNKNITSLISEIKDLKNFQIVDMNGKICFSFDEVKAKIKYEGEDRFINNEILPNIRSISSSYIKTFKDKNLLLLIVQPVFDFYQRHVYSVVFSYSLNSLAKQSFYLLLYSLVLFIILMIINYFFSFIFASYLTKPLKIVLDSIKKSREQEYKTNIRLDFDYEFNLLASEFNKMMKIIRNERNLIINTLSNLKTGILVIDKNDRITLCNQTFSKFLSIDRLPFENELYYNFFPELKKLENIINKVKENKNPENIEGEIFSSLIQSYFNIEILPLILDDDEKVVIRIDNITNNVQIQRRLVQLQKGELINSLASGLAHDFNNLIGSIKSTAILANADILSKKIEKISELSDYLEIIMDIAKSAEGVVQHLLLLSKHREFTKSKINLIDVLDKVIKISKISINKTVKIEFSNFIQAPCLVDADDILLEEIFFNLIVNASHAMTIMRKENEKWGGTVQLEIHKIDCFSLSDISENYFLFNSEELVQNSLGKKFYKISVIDSGVGIEKENFNKIFQPFFSTKSDNMGTGLGLSMVLTLVQLHKGLLDLISNKNLGSNFSIYLPVYEEK
jgi:signal transduction histidine kinase